MSVRLFLLKGISFQRLLEAVGNCAGFAVNPNGAPLGEEPTRHLDFQEARCSGWLSFPELPGRHLVRLSGYSLRNGEWEIFFPERRWNQKRDTLIHLCTIDLPDNPLMPDGECDWSQSKSTAPAFYLFCKRLFLHLQCDAAEAIDTHVSVLFHWVRIANYQTVIFPYESGREVSEEEGYRREWQTLCETDQIFPQLRLSESEAGASFA